eukprot:274474_1
MRDSQSSGSELPSSDKVGISSDQIEGLSSGTTAISRKSEASDDVVAVEQQDLSSKPIPNEPAAELVPPAAAELFAAPSASVARTQRNARRKRAVGVSSPLVGATTTTPPPASDQIQSPAVSYKRKSLLGVKFVYSVLQMEALRDAPAVRRKTIKLPDSIDKNKQPTKKREKKWERDRDNNNYDNSSRFDRSSRFRNDRDNNSERGGSERGSGRREFRDLAYKPRFPARGSRSARASWNRDRDRGDEAEYNDRRTPDDRSDTSRADSRAARYDRGGGGASAQNAGNSRERWAKGPDDFEKSFRFAREPRKTANISANNRSEKGRTPDHRPGGGRPSDDFPSDANDSGPDNIDAKLEGHRADANDHGRRGDSRPAWDVDSSSGDDDVKPFQFGAKLDRAADRAFIDRHGYLPDGPVAPQPPPSARPVTSISAAELLGLPDGETFPKSTGSDQPETTIKIEEIHEKSPEVSPMTVVPKNIVKASKTVAETSSSGDGPASPKSVGTGDSGLIAAKQKTVSPSYAKPRITRPMRDSKPGSPATSTASSPKRRPAGGPAVFGEPAPVCTTTKIAAKVTALPGLSQLDRGNHHARPPLASLDPGSAPMSQQSSTFTSPELGAKRQPEHDVNSRHPEIDANHRPPAYDVNHRLDHDVSRQMELDMSRRSSSIDVESLFDPNGKPPPAEHRMNGSMEHLIGSLFDGGSSPGGAGRRSEEREAAMAYEMRKRSDPRYAFPHGDPAHPSSSSHSAQEAAARYHQMYVNRHARSRAEQAAHEHAKARARYAHAYAHDQAAAQAAHEQYRHHMSSSGTNSVSRPGYKKYFDARTGRYVYVRHGRSSDVYANAAGGGGGGSSSGSGSMDYRKYAEYQGQKERYYRSRAAALAHANIDLTDVQRGELARRYYDASKRARHQQQMAVAALSRQQQQQQHQQQQQQQQQLAAAAVRRAESRSELDALLMRGASVEEVLPRLNALDIDNRTDNRTRVELDNRAERVGRVELDNRAERVGRAELDNRAEQNYAASGDAPLPQLPSLQSLGLSSQSNSGGATQSSAAPSAPSESAPNTSSEMTQQQILRQAMSSQQSQKSRQYYSGAPSAHQPSASQSVPNYMHASIHPRPYGHPSGQAPSSSHRLSAEMEQMYHNMRQPPRQQPRSSDYERAAYTQNAIAAAGRAGYE